jgi:nuclear mRNA export protein PCID2/THP1
VERTLKKAFSVTNGDRSNCGAESKRVGTLEVINQLFRVYFKLNALRLCQHLIRTVNAPGFLDFDSSFPVAHRVTYKFYVGRLHLYEDRYSEAVDNLTYAVDRTPEQYEINKRLVLLYLIPARILRGTLPSRRLLKGYNMFWYEDISRALRTGNLRLFDEAVERHEQFFIRKGLYLAIEKMRSLVYRSLCSKLYNARVAMAKVDPHKVKLEDVQLSLRVCGVEMSKDEVECILANLIYNGIIKGYLSHTVGYLVLSTKNAFPPLCKD